MLSLFKVNQTDIELREIHSCIKDIKVYIYRIIINFQCFAEWKRCQHGLQYSHNQYFISSYWNQIRTQRHYLLFNSISLLIVRDI